MMLASSSPRKPDRDNPIVHQGYSSAHEWTHDEMYVLADRNARVIGLYPRDRPDESPFARAADRELALAWPAQGIKRLHEREHPQRLWAAWEGLSLESRVPQAIAGIMAASGWMERIAAEERRVFADRRMADLAESAKRERREIAPAAKAEAGRILRELAGLPDDTEISVEADGTVAIEVLRHPGASFGLFCEPSGEALCVVYADGVSRRARYRNSRILPDCFLREGLNAVLAQA